VILFPRISKWDGTGGSSAGGNGLELCVIAIAVLLVFCAIFMEAGRRIPAGGSEVDEYVEYCPFSDALVCHC
jgi:hypothetical protein